MTITHTRRNHPPHHWRTERSRRRLHGRRTVSGGKGGGPKRNCGTLDQLDEFRLSQLDWLRNSPVLQTIEVGLGPDDEGKEGDEDERSRQSKRSVFWKEVAAKFPKDRAICTLECTDVGAFMRTMDVWHIDMDMDENEEVLAAFMKLVFSGGTNAAFAAMLKDAPTPAVAAERRLFRGANKRFANLMTTWGRKLPQVWMLRAAIAFPHPSIDKYVQSQVSDATFRDDVQSYAEAYLRGNRGNDIKFRLVLELMHDACVSGHMGWFKWLDGFLPDVPTDEDELEKVRDSIWSSDVFQSAVILGRPDCLLWMTDEKTRFGKFITKSFLNDELVEAVFRGTDEAVRILSQRFDALFPRSSEDEEEDEIDNDDEDGDDDVDDRVIKWKDNTGEIFQNPTAVLIQLNDMARLKLVMELGCRIHKRAQLYAVISGDAAMIEFCDASIGHALTLPIMQGGRDVTDRILEDTIAQNYTDRLTLRREIARINRAAQFLRQHNLEWTDDVADSMYHSIFTVRSSLLWGEHVHAVSALYAHNALPVRQDTFNSLLANPDGRGATWGLRWLLEHGAPLPDLTKEDMLDSNKYSFARMYATINAVRAISV